MASRSGTRNAGLRRGNTKAKREEDMKLVSWNVNGLRACVGKGFYESMAALDAERFLEQHAP